MNGDGRQGWRPTPLTGKDRMKTTIIRPNLRRLLKERKLTQRQLARRSGISEQRICDILAGRDRGRYEFFTVYELARGLGVSVEELAGLEFATAESTARAVAQLKTLPFDDFLPLLKRFGYTPKQIEFVRLLQLKDIDDQTLNAVIELLKLKPRSKRK